MTPADTPREFTRPRGIRWRLAVMMLLQYAVWGIWLPILPMYLQTGVAQGGLGFSAMERLWILAVAAAIGAVSAPLIGGQLADRYFATERYLAVAMLAGGVVNWVISYQTGFWPWLLLSTLYAVIYMPTLGLTNGLAMAHLSDPKREFPRVRVWGTVGWIVVAWGFPMLWLQTDVQWTALPPFFRGVDRPDAVARTVDTLRVSGTLSLAYGLFCLLLPHTPPQRQKALEQGIGARLPLAEVAGLLRLRSVQLLVVSSLAIAAIHKVYFMQTSTYLAAVGVPKGYILPAMAIGQLAEVGVMVLLGSLLTRLGFRGVLTLGAVCYAARFAVFGTTWLPLGVIVASQALHGFCFACSFAAAFLYIDRLAAADVRHTAQTGLTMILLGIGPILGGLLNAALETWSVTPQGAIEYQGFWYACSAVGLAVAVAVGLLFRDQAEPGDGRSPREVAA